MAIKKKVLLFDIDGTLIITDGAGATSWARAFEEIYNIEVDVNNYSDTGMTDPEVGRRSFLAVVGHNPSSKEFSQLLERRMHYLTESVNEASGYRVLPGVEALLPKLTATGFLLGLVTGNLEAAAHIKLHRAKLNQYFSFGGYGSDSPVRSELTKTAMHRATVIYGDTLVNAQYLAIGDTPNDVIAAHQVGIECVGVASHKYSAEDLRLAEADYVLHSLEEPLPIW